MGDLYQVRVKSVERHCLTCHVTELHGGPGYDLVASRTLACGFLWDTTEWYWWMERVRTDGGTHTKEELEAVARSTPLGREVDPDDFLGDGNALREKAERFVSCVGVVDRLHHQERDPDEDIPPGEAPQATYRISVTNPQWLEHLTPGMEWGSRVWDRDLPNVFDSTWRTPTVISIAKHVNESQDFSGLPILADALQDAGCDNDDILNHFRDPNATHVRGCWALALVLGKE